MHNMWIMENNSYFINTSLRRDWISARLLETQDHLLFKESVSPQWRIFCLSVPGGCRPIAGMGDHSAGGLLPLLGWSMAEASPDNISHIWLLPWARYRHSGSLRMFYYSSCLDHLVGSDFFGTRNITRTFQTSYGLSLCGAGFIRYFSYSFSHLCQFQ